ncbi:unnamed protein product [Protopolystoma xenopodis]|uniref:C-CAP/cofactor C-like domain-containing protein n=1 Tax=Protopolystoma xenopodis TaxID=117903 RepID=A0A448WPD3_9PLAT|nr:unnamed protein product [Protopolystoma xenopodis]
MNNHINPTQDLNRYFQAKREILLPKKRFAFSSRAKPDIPCTNPSSSGAHSQHLQLLIEPTSSNVTDQLASSIAEAQELDSRFALVDIKDRRDLRIPVRPTETALCPVSTNLDDSKPAAIFLADLIDCRVIIETDKYCFGSLTARGLRNSRIVVKLGTTRGILGPIWLDECHNCDLLLAGRQMRLHRVHSSRLAISTTSHPIIEDCSGLQIAPYYSESLQQQQLIRSDDEGDGFAADEADLASKTAACEPMPLNLWKEIEDFSCPTRRLNTSTGSPNWCLLPKTEWDGLFCDDDEEKKFAEAGSY